MSTRTDLGRPRIGITVGADQIAEYERAVAAAGGEPVQLASDEARAADDVLALDGLVLSGGADVDPARYGRARHERTEPALPARDAYEAALAAIAYTHGLPTLAICRGIQIANVAFGGTLVQHVPDVTPAGIPHELPADDPERRGLIPAHRVEIEPASRLARIVGRTHLVTGSRHHQALERVAERLRVVGRTADGIIEAVESPEEQRFWLGVQWHPESTVNADGGASRALFRALIDAATGPSVKGPPSLAER
jgi:putative glutamine amidotransferase